MSGYGDYYDMEGQPIDLFTWARMFEDGPSRTIGRDIIGEYVVSTVWLGLNHQWWPDRPPLIFETMVFIGDSWDDQYMHRYSTKEQALQGHNDVVATIRALNDITAEPES